MFGAWYGAKQGCKANKQGLGAWCYARIRCKVRVQRFGAVLGAVRVQSKQARVKVVRVYIYQANAWYGGGRVFEIEFQF